MKDFLNRMDCFGIQLIRLIIQIAKLLVGVDLGNIRSMNYPRRYNHSIILIKRFFPKIVVMPIILAK